MALAMEPGSRFSRSFSVDRGRTIGFMGPQLRVYATPAIVQDLETACREWMLERIDPGEDSVGAVVEIEHLRPTPLGMEATHAVTVTRVEGRRIFFEITVRDAIEEVARARHQRVVVAKDRLAAAVKAKRDRMGRPR
jgi:fluoroacetyl-CoA thioesterase